jgi:DNA-binding winged helix-turn-helix (wHTH) protein
MRPDPGNFGQDMLTAELTVGAYRFHRETRRLTSRGGTLVPLGRRATALLSILADHVGKDVSAAQLLDRVWPGQIVDPANVAVQISGLRAAIGDSDGSVILTVHGRGYRLATSGAAMGSVTAGNMPLPLAPLSGREVELTNAIRRLRRDRLLVITGLSGIGKTRLALAAANAMLGDFPDGRWLVAMNGHLFPDTPSLASHILTILGGTPGADPVAALLDQLGTGQTLLLLDGAEGLEECAQDLVQRLVAERPCLCVLITSHVAHPRLRRACVRLSPLAIPGNDTDTAPAMDLFLTAANAAGLRIDTDATPSIVRICRQLGGVPLGVEIAARAASLLGLSATADASRDPMRALPLVRRPGPARHRSVGAAMTWALGMLTDTEQRALRILSTLPGDFTRAEAELVLSRAGADQPRRWLARLDSKSMLEHAGEGLSLNPLVRAGTTASVLG